MATSRANFLNRCLKAVLLRHACAGDGPVGFVVDLPVFEGKSHVARAGTS
jgi:hypothetical protein